MKIRGSASHIAGKYASLARDARATGDPVSSENYWQHAEHYNRIVQSAESQAQEKRQNAVPNPGAGGHAVSGQRRQPHEGQAPEGQQRNLANGSANGSTQGSAQGSAQGTAPAPAHAGQDAAEGEAQDTSPADDDDAPVRKAAVAKPVRKRAKPRPKAPEKPAASPKTETAPTEEAG